MADATYEATVSMAGFEEQAQQLEQFPMIFLDVVGETMEVVTIEVASAIKTFTPVHMGTLISKIGGEVEMQGGPNPNVIGIVDDGGVPYAVPVELGRRPGSMPPIAPIRRWAELVLGDAGAAWAIAISIMRRGTRPRAMFAQGWRKMLPRTRARFVKARDDIVVKLGKIRVGMAKEVKP